MSQSVSPESHGGEGNTKPPLKARGWCMTWNNYLDEDFEAIKAWMSQKSHWVLAKSMALRQERHIYRGTSTANNKSASRH